MVLFGRASFLTGVIAAQSQHRAAKVCLSRKISDVTKNSHALKKIFEILLREVSKYNLEDPLRRILKKIFLERVTFFVTSVMDVEKN